MEKVKFDRNVHTLEQAATTPFVFDLESDPLLLDGDNGILKGRYNTYLSAGTEIVAHACQDRRVVLSDVAIGDSSKLSGFLYVDNGVSVGEKSTIGRTITMGDDITIGTDCTLEDQVTIGNDAVIGSNAIISNSVTVGDEVSMGLGASVSSSFSAGENFCLTPIAFGPEPKKTVFGNFATFGRDSKFMNFDHKGVAPYPEHEVVFGYDTTFGPGCTFFCPVTLHSNTTVGKDAFFTSEVKLEGPEITLGDGTVFHGLVTATRSVHFGSGVVFNGGLCYLGFDVKRYLLLDSLDTTFLGGGQVKILLVEEKGELKTLVETAHFFGTLRVFLAEMDDRCDVFRDVVAACGSALLQAYKESL